MTNTPLNNISPIAEAKLQSRVLFMWKAIWLLIKVPDAPPTKAGVM